MKLLMIGADSVEPSIIYKNIKKFKHIHKLIDNGVKTTFSAYVQKGFNGSYSSEQNWATIYTGIEPKEHGIHARTVRGEKRRPQMGDFCGLEPFWEVCNQHGLSVGLWAAGDCASPVDIDGYAVSISSIEIEIPQLCREAQRTLQLSPYAQKKLSHLFPTPPPPRLYPKTLQQHGKSFVEFQNNPNEAWEYLQNYNFQECLINFKEELDYWYNAIKRAELISPVDVLYFYTPAPDIIAHSCMYCDDNEVLLESYLLLDEFLGKLVDDCDPEYTILLSDHGQQNFKDLIKTDDKALQREVFAGRDKVIWLKNGYLAFEAYNGALLFSAHAPNAMFIVGGKEIDDKSPKYMRTIDVYPTVLELLQLPIPENRLGNGYVMDIFRRPLINPQFLLKDDSIKCLKIALIQSVDFNIHDISLNELFLLNRFAQITVVGYEKYRSIALSNPRVANFISFDEFQIADFDSVYCTIYHHDSEKIDCIKIS